MREISPKRTSLESIIEEALNTLNIYYIPQFPTRTGFIIDYAIPDKKIALEIDGPYHDTKEQKKRDSFKDYMLKREGWQVIRIHWTKIEGKSVKEIAKMIKDAIQL